MQYLTDSELRRLFQVAYNRNRNHHLALVTAWAHGMRVSELVNLRGTDITREGVVIVRRLKGSNTSAQPIHKDADVLFDQSPIIALAQERGSMRLFDYCRSYINKLMIVYGTEAGIHRRKLHPHAIKHSTAMRLWSLTTNLGKIQSYLGHKSAGSTLIYLHEADHTLAQQAFAQAVTA